MYNMREMKFAVQSAFPAYGLFYDRTVGVKSLLFRFTLIY